MIPGQPADRFNSRKVVVPPTGVRKRTLIVGTAVAALLSLGTAGVSHASDDCTPSNRTDATPGAWSWSEFTLWSTDNTPPADRDGQTGDDNLANLSQIGEGWNDTADDAYRTKVDDGWKRFTDWSTNDTAPAVGANEEAGNRSEKVVGNNDAVPATEGTPAVPGIPAVPGKSAVWASFSPNKDQGPLTGTPSYPSDSRGTWNVTDKIPGGHEGPDGTYSQSGGSGNGSWFYRSAGTPGTPATEGTPAVPGTSAKAETFHTEYRFEVYAFHYEYRWSVYERGITEGTEAVTCDDDETPDKESTDEPDLTEELTAEPTEAPETPETPAGEPTESDTPETSTPVVHAVKHKQHKQHAPVAAVPTTIDAGL